MSSFFRLTLPSESGLMMREPRDVLLPDGAALPAARPAWALPRRCGNSGAYCYQMAQDNTLRSARPGATTLTDSSDVVLEAVARPVRESWHVLGQTCGVGGGRRR